MSTDDAWELWGQRDPYFGVITHERFRRGKLDEKARAEFFNSGRVHADYILAMCRHFIDPHFTPRHVLDFGCGVGRLVIPFAAMAELAVGLDVSPSMLEEARRNCEAAGVANVRLEQSGDDLGTHAGAYDLVHTFIVLQHIEPARVRALFGQLVRALRPGGIGAIHVTYAKAWLADSFGVDPNPAPTSPAAEEPRGLRALLGGLRGTNPPAAEDEPDPAADPEIQMHSHNLNTLLFQIQTAGVRRFHADFTDHGGDLGMILVFQVPPAA